MFVVDKQGAQWQIDEGIRERTGLLIHNFEEELGHVNLDQCIFLRLMGSKATWHSKTFFIGKAPMTIIPKFVLAKLSKLGLMDLEGVRNLEGFDIFDIRFIVVLNDDAISQAEGDLQRVEDLALFHEMLHIHPDGDRVVKHDLEDFSVLVDKFGPYWSQGIFSDTDNFEGVVDNALAEAIEAVRNPGGGATVTVTMEQEPTPVAPQFTPPPPPVMMPKSGKSEVWNPEESD